jgi:hypothetical protein
MTVAVLFPTMSFHYQAETLVGAEERVECAAVNERVNVHVCVWIDLSGGRQCGFTLLCANTGLGLDVFSIKRGNMRGVSM